MADAACDAIIGRTLLDHESLKRHWECMAPSADQIHQAVYDGLQLIKYETAGDTKEDIMFIASAQHGMNLTACNWHSVEAMDRLASDRD